MEEFEWLVPVDEEHVSLILSHPASEPMGVVLLVPPYAMQSRDLFPIALALSRNGFTTARLDGRNALGRGSGLIYDFTMSTAATDVVTALSALRGAMPDKPLIATGLSLAARSVVRALTTVDADAAVFFTPVFNLRSTLAEVLDEDFFAVPHSELPDSLRVLGHRVSRDFVVDAAAGAFDSLQTCLDELGHLRGRVGVLCGDEDPWVAVADVALGVASLNCSPDVVTVRAASHELNRNPRVAMAYLDELVRQCRRLVDASEDVAIPKFSELIAERGRTTAVASEVLAKPSGGV